VSELIPQDTTNVATATETLRDRARQLAEGSRAANTLTAYASDMARFRAWCAEQRPPLQALPAQPRTVALYLAALADLRTPATIRRRIASISVVW
jgi:site-specific recombinase XerD